MLKLCLLACMLGVPCCAAASSFQVAGDGSSPEMVRLSLGPTPASMLVQWTQNTSACIPGSRGIVSFGLSAENLGQTASGNCTQWAEGNPSGIHFTFTVLLPDLAPRTKYFYRVAAASSSLCSPVFHFTSLTNDPNFNPNILFFGNILSCFLFLSESPPNPLNLLQSILHLSSSPAGSLCFTVAVAVIAGDLGHKGGAQALKLFTALPGTDSLVSPCGRGICGT